MISFETVKEKVEELGYKIELKNNGVQFYIKCKKGAVNYYPKDDIWVDEKSVSHTNLNQMFRYLKVNTERLLPEYKMSKFDLEKALQGEPVRLRDGSKAYVLGDLRELFGKSKELRCLIGVVSQLGNTDAFEGIYRWKCTGRYYEHLAESECDIIGMWVEPKLTIPELMEKALNENLTVKSRAFGLYHTGFKVIAKTQDGSDYVLQAVGGDNAQVYLQSAVSAMDDDWSIA